MRVADRWKGAPPWGTVPPRRFAGATIKPSSRGPLVSNPLGRQPDRPAMMSNHSPPGGWQSGQRIVRTYRDRGRGPSRAWLSVKGRRRDPSPLSTQRGGSSRALKRACLLARCILRGRRAPGVRGSPDHLTPSPRAPEQVPSRQESRATSDVRWRGIALCVLFLSALIVARASLRPFHEHPP